MTPLGWLFVELVAATLAGAAIAYGIVLWIGQPKESFATPEPGAAGDGSNNGQWSRRGLTNVRK